MEFNKPNSVIIDGKELLHPCLQCEHRKAMSSRKKGVRIPEQSGKCTRPGGFCSLPAAYLTVEMIHNVHSVLKSDQEECTSESEDNEKGTDMAELSDTDTDFKKWETIIREEGENYRERERIKRKIQRWLDNLREMSELERRAFLAALRDEGFIDAQRLKVPESVPEEKKEIPVREKFYLIRDLIAKHGGQSGTARIDRVRSDYPYDDFDDTVIMAAKRYIVELVSGDPTTMTREEIDNCMKIDKFQYLNMLWHEDDGIW